MAESADAAMTEKGEDAAAEAEEEKKEEPDETTEAKAADEQAEGGEKDTTADAPAEETPGQATDISTEDAGWLLEDAARVRLLAECSGMDITVSAEGKATWAAKEGQANGGNKVAEQLIHIACACRSGRTVDVDEEVVKDAPEGWESCIAVVEVPAEIKEFVLGKGGQRVAKICEESGVFAAFGRSPEKPYQAASTEAAEKSEEATAGSGDIKVGDLVEAKFGKKDRYFEAIVKAVVDDMLTLKWTYDDDIPTSEVSKSAAKLLKAAPPPKTFKVGDVVEAKFAGKDRPFEAIVKQVVDDKLTIKWTYDPDLPPSEVLAADATLLPPAPIEKIYIFGRRRGVMEMELKVLNLVEAKVEGFVTNEPRKTDNTDELGWTVVALKNQGELKAKLIGKGGSVRIKISKACGSSLEYVGHLAYIVGTGPQRARTVALLDLVQNSSAGGVPHVPPEMEAICSWVAVPQAASAMVIGKKRASMNALEDETGCSPFGCPSRLTWRSSQPPLPRTLKRKTRR